MYLSSPLCKFSIDTYHYFFDCPLHNEIRQQRMQNLISWKYFNSRSPVWTKWSFSWHEYHDIQTRTHIHPPQQRFVALILNTNLKITKIHFKHVTQLLSIHASRSLPNITPVEPRLARLSDSFILSLSLTFTILYDPVTYLQPTNCLLNYILRLTLFLELDLCWCTRCSLTNYSEKRLCTSSWAFFSILILLF